MSRARKFHTDLIWHNTRTGEWAGLATSLARVWLVRAGYQDPDAEIAKIMNGEIVSTGEIEYRLNPANGGVREVNGNTS